MELDGIRYSVFIALISEHFLKFLNERKTMIMKQCFLAVLCVVLVLHPCRAEKLETITTRDGKVFNQVEITKVEAGGIRFIHAGGFSFVPFINLSDDLQKKWNYDPNATPPPPTVTQAVPVASTEVPTISNEEISYQRYLDKKADAERIMSEAKARLEEIKKVNTKEIKEISDRIRKEDRDYATEYSRSRIKPAIKPFMRNPEETTVIQALRKKIEASQNEYNIKQNNYKLLTASPPPNPEKNGFTSKERVLLQDQEQAQKANAVETALMEMEKRKESLKKELASQEIPPQPEQSKATLKKISEQQNREEAEKQGEEEIQKIAQLLAEGSLAEAYTQTEALSNSSKREYRTNTFLHKLSDWSLEIYKSAVKKEHLPIAYASIKISISCWSDNPKLTELIIITYEQLLSHVKNRDFDKISRLMQFIESMDTRNLSSKYKQEVSIECMNAAYEDLKSFKIFSSWEAFNTAKGLWEDNPRLAWYRAIIGVAVFCLIILFGVILPKIFGKTTP